jgi:tRNA uridine 5-carboxymethylaminomethyl modification enzyme
LVDSDRAAKAKEKIRCLQALRAFVAATPFEGGKLEQWLKRPDRDWQNLAPELLSQFPVALWDTVQTDLRYGGYIARQEAAVAKLRDGEGKLIPANLCYDTVLGLRQEARQKLTRVRPATLSQAARIPGVTPADLAILSVLIQ